MRDSKGRFFIRLLLFLLVFILAAEALGFALSPAESFTRQSLHDLYQEKGSLKMVCVGASHALYGFDTAVVDRMLETSSFNLGSASQKVMDSYFLLREMYRSNRPDLVLVEITYAMYTRFAGHDNPMSSMILFDYFRPGANKAVYLKEAFSFADYPALFLKAYRYRNRLGKISATMKKKLASGWLSYDPAAASYQDERYLQKGFVFSDGGFPQGGMGRVMPYKWDEDHLNPDAFLYLEKIVRLCREAGSEVVFFSTPLPMATLLTLGNYGDVHRYFSGLAQELGVPYLDFNLVREDRHARPDTDYFDTNHLNGSGASSFSRSLCRLLTDGMQPGGDLSTWFYPDFEAMKKEYREVANVYLSAKEEDDLLVFTARSYQGDDLEPEYRFLIRPQAGETFTVIQDYSPHATLKLTRDRASGSEIRVECRAGAWTEAFCYDVLKFTEP